MALDPITLTITRPSRRWGQAARRQGYLSRKRPEPSDRTTHQQKWLITPVGFPAGLIDPGAIAKSTLGLNRALRFPPRMPTFRPDIDFENDNAVGRRDISSHQYRQSHNAIRDAESATPTAASRCSSRLSRLGKPEEP